MKDNSMLFLLVWLWKYYGMNRTSHSPGTICLCRWGGSHMCFLYTWSRQGGCGVPSDPLLVFLIALLNLWAARDPHTSHNTRFLGRGRAKGRRLQRQQRCLCCSYLAPPPLPQRKPYKYKQSHEFWYCICLSPAQTMLSQPCWRMESKRILKLINYYFRLCRNKESGDHSLVLLLLSYINWNVMFICLFVLIETGFSIQWPNTYLILSDLLSCKISFIKTVVTWWKQWINL